MPPITLEDIQLMNALRNHILFSCSFLWANTSDLEVITAMKGAGWESQVAVLDLYDGDHGIYSILKQGGLAQTRLESLEWLLCAIERAIDEAIIDTSKENE